MSGMLTTGHRPPDTQGQALQLQALAALLERRILGPLHSVEPISGGDVNLMILLNGEMVLRLNVRDPHLPKSAKEALIYRRLHQSTLVPCPEVLALDTARDLVPYDALILSRVPGVNAGTVWAALDEDTREALSEEAGRLCAEIHGLRWPAYGDFDAKTGTFGQYWRWTDMLLARLEEVAAQALALKALPQILIDGVVTELNDGEAVFETASRPVLVHGDLHIGNLLVEQAPSGDDARWHITAILDWEWSLTADAAWELAGLWSSPAKVARLGDAFLYGHRDRPWVASHLWSCIHLYNLTFHAERAVSAQAHFTATPEWRCSHELSLG